MHTSSPLLQLSILFLSEERACEQHHDLSLCVSITERLYLSQSQESRDYTVIILSLNFLLPNSVPAPYHHQQQIFPFSFIFPILFPADNIITTNRSIHVYKLYINFVVSKHIFYYSKCNRAKATCHLTTTISPSLYSCFTFTVQRSALCVVSTVIA